jgi:hypothetical protein
MACVVSKYVLKFLCFTAEISSIVHPDIDMFGSLAPHKVDALNDERSQWYRRFPQAATSSITLYPSRPHPE